METYIDSKGKVIVIRDMVNSHLLNAYAKHKQRLNDLNNAIDTGTYDATDPQLMKLKAKNENIVAAMRKEIDKRNLL